MLKKIFVVSLSIIVIAATAVFLYRYQIIRYSAETVIRKLLPDYITIDKINFDFKDSKVTLVNIGISNPPGFSYKYLLEIGEMSCGYKMKGSNILDGLEIAEPVFKKPVLAVERLADGRTNLQEMQKVLEKRQGPPSMGQEKIKKEAKKKDPGIIGDKTLSDIVRLPENFAVKGGSLIFLDWMAAAKPRTITLENVEGGIGVRLDKAYTRVLRASSIGGGDINGKAGQTVKWNVILDPTTPRLTMSNRFEVSGADIMTFEPYYDRYSPFIFKRGYFSGTMIFDFNNGNIGSTNEVRLSNISFSIKKGYENAQFWETTVPDLVKYFTSSTGDIVFDFKIKGDMSKPNFYLGPISKQALVSMTVDKVSAMLEKAAKSDGTGAAQGPKSDLGKAMGILKSLMKDK